MHNSYEISWRKSRRWLELMIKVIIAGGRDFQDWDKLVEVCDRVFKDYSTVEIVSGAAKGADRLGEQYANERGHQIKQFPADWDKYGKSAGYRRNAEMANYAGALIAFWDGVSRGTSHMINLAKEKGLKILIINY
jgi:hypothetical protein